MKQPSASQTGKWLTAIKPALSELAGDPISELAVKELVKKCFSTVQPKLKPSVEATAAAFDSIKHLIGCKASSSFIVRNVTRLLANWHFIREGMRVPEWDGTRATTDMIVLGVARLSSDAASKPSYIVAMKLKTGLPAGIISCSSFTEAAIYYFLEHVSGTAKLECAAEEIAGMAARVSVTFLNGRLKVHEWSCTADQKKHNADLAERRMDVRKCDFAPTPCNVCSKTIKECPLAVWLPKKDQ